MTEIKKPSGRPKKAEHEKIQYQRIAVYSSDYLKLTHKIEQKNKQLAPENKVTLIDAFSQMVKKY